MSFLVPELIRKKRLGTELSKSEIDFLVDGFSTNKIEDYQIAAWLMACFVKPLTETEVLNLTEAMKNSGHVIHWEKQTNIKSHDLCDKHSTGGVGDKVSIILAPLVAEMGLKVPMMSGRGLGFTGGTVDKLESIPGFQMVLEQSAENKALLDSGFVMLKQSETLCPADKKLYALRDVTATVEDVGLITASIVSKKWAAGVRNIVYDVKCGPAAFMSEYSDAKRLARSLVAVSKRAGMNARALITRMDEPLGSCVGNGIEILESTWILRNSYPSENHKRIAAPLVELITLTAAHMYQLCRPNTSLEENQKLAYQILDSGAAFKRFLKMIEIQSLNCHNQKQSPQAVLETLEAQINRAPRMQIKAKKDGILKNIRSRDLGLIGIDLKIGREKTSDSVDSVAGFVLNKQVGDTIQMGDVLAEVIQGQVLPSAEILQKIEKIFEITNEPPSTGDSKRFRSTLFLEVINT